MSAGPWHMHDTVTRLKPAAGQSLALLLSQMMPKPLLIVLASAAIGFGVTMPTGLEVDARLSLFAFGIAALLWATSKIEAGYVAMAAALFLALTGAIEQERLFESLGSKVVWLMIGAFVVGAAAEETGLAARLSLLASAKVRNVREMMWITSMILVPLTFLIPSTSGRAAAVLPMFKSMTAAAAMPSVTRALAILIPSVILVSTIASITGAGSHLIAIDLLAETSGKRISFGEWMLWGVPFALAAVGVTVWTVCKLLLTDAEQDMPVVIDLPKAAPVTAREKYVLAIFAAMVGLWMTEALHGIEIATVSIGALVVCAPGIGILSWKKAAKAVNWPLVVFVAAALLLGEAIIDTGAAQWLVGAMFTATGLQDGGSSLAVLIGLSIVTLTAHIYMTSHAARTAALLPPLLLLAAELKIDPVAVAFLATVGINYCLTFPVSSKALLMFQEMNCEDQMPADLLRLSAVLLPLHLLLMIIFYFGYWRHIGIAL
jgi:anion transporter